jgi:hypothetical protein
MRMTPMLYFSRGSNLRTGFYARGRVTPAMKKVALAIAAIAFVWCGSASAGPYLLQTQTQSGTYGDSGVPGQTLMGSGSLSVQTTKNGGAMTSNASVSAGVSYNASGVPETMLTASASYTETHPYGGYYPYAEASGELIYTVTVNGPASGSAIVDFSLSAQTSGAYGVTEALFGVNVEGGGLSLNNGFFGQLTSGSSTPIEVGTTTFNQSVSVGSSTQFMVELSVDAMVDPTVEIYGGFPPPASVTASIDPTFSIDPKTPNANEFSLSYSPGLLTPASVPEPNTLILMAIGAAGLIGLRKRLIRD